DHRLEVPADGRVVVAIPVLVQVGLLVVVLTWIPKRREEPGARPRLAAPVLVPLHHESVARITRCTDTAQEGKRLSLTAGLKPELHAARAGGDPVRELSAGSGHSGEQGTLGVVGIV